jgi:hypothetical protein
MANWTPIAELPRIVEEVKAAFKTGKTRLIEWRKNQLRQLWRMIDVCIENPLLLLYSLKLCAQKLPRRLGITSCSI